MKRPEEYGTEVTGKYLGDGPDHHPGRLALEEFVAEAVRAAMLECLELLSQSGLSREFVGWCIREAVWPGGGSVSGQVVAGQVEHYYHEIPGWFDFQDVYREAVRRTPDGGTLVEVGCWKGKSLCFLLVEARDSGKWLNVLGVDHFRGSVGEPALLEEAADKDLEGQCRRNCDRAGHPYGLLRMASEEAAGWYADGGIDFVFLDGSHDYDSVRADIEAWLPKVKPGGVLAGHDRALPGVARAVAERLPDARPFGSCWWFEKGESYA
jgi:hypothetical protein